MEEKKQVAEIALCAIIVIKKKNNQAKFKVMFTENQKLEDLLKINTQLILMLPRFKMDLGFGDKKVQEVCKERNIPTSMFLAICNVYTFDHYTPSPKEIQEIDENILIEYLQISHDYYLNQRLTHIKKHIEKIADNAGKIGDVLKEFFSNYSHEMEKHFQMEEMRLFKKSSDKHDVDEQFIFEEVEESHATICDHLKDLTGEATKSLKFHPDVGAKLTQIQKAAITAKNWVLVY